MQSEKNTVKKRLNVVLLLLLPVLYFYIGIFFKSEIGPYHLFVTDPEYAYLLNGLNICKLSLPYQVNGPGTPLQLFCALIIKIVHMVRNQDDIITDVIKNPDIYLNIINTSLIIVTSIVILITGYGIYKTSSKISLGIFFQIMPFASWQIIDIAKLILVENFVVIGVMCLITLVFIFIYRSENSNNHKIIDKYILGFSVIIGFISANKLMYLPIAIIPFLLIQGYKRKMAYTLLSAIAFALLSYPIFYYWVSFRDWYWTNLVHSGQYGAGKTTFIDIRSFTANLRSVFTSDHFYFKAFIIVLFGSMIYHLPFLKVKEKRDKSYLFLIGILITMMVMSFLVSKQFKYYYMTTALLLSIPGLFVVYSIFGRRISERMRPFYEIPIFIIVVYFAYNETKLVFDVHREHVMRKESYLNTKLYIEKRYQKNQPTLLIANYYGAPYKAYGLFYGMAWCGQTMGAKYAVALKKYYPNIYIYHGWNNLFNQWGNSHSFIDLLIRYQNVVLFVGDPDSEKKLASKLHGLNRQMDTKFTKIISFERTRETIFEVSYDSCIGASPYTLIFDAEVLDSSGNYFIGNKNFKTENGNTQSNDFARSGSHSSKLTKESPYSMTSILSEVRADDHFRISIWRYNNNNKNAGLVVAAHEQEKLYVFKNESSKVENHWQKMEIELTIPSVAHMQDIRIYCWNNDPELPAYFDDLLIEKLVP